MVLGNRRNEGDNMTGIGSFRKPLITIQCRQEPNSVPLVLFADSYMKAEENQRTLRLTYSPQQRVFKYF